MGEIKFTHPFKRSVPETNLQSLIQALPPPVDVIAIRSSRKVVVLDDDPTGTQTVHGIRVLTRWKREDLERELLSADPGFFILTNSRALKPEDAVGLASEIGANLKEASETTGVPLTVVSRGDSTLRGHFPAETDALARALGGGFSGTILVPAMFSGGRITIGDVHYVRSGDVAIPVGESEFARDSTFGFKSSNLRDYVAEKTSGRISRDEVISISLEDLRIAGEAAVAQKLTALHEDGAAIVNAADPCDLRVLAHALADESLKERRFMFRTAAEFVAAILAISPRSLLGREELVAPGAATGGLLVAGSHVAQTSRQLEALQAAHPALERIQVEVQRLLAADTRADEIARCRTRIDATLAAGRPAVAFTSRSVVKTGAPDSDLDIAVSVSAALVEIVSGLSVRPSWLIAKGGITSSDIATKALGIVRATVLGQALPGVPVWKCGDECKWPGLCYVVFPGNVGGTDSLARLVHTLTAGAGTGATPISGQ